MNKARNFFVSELFVWILFCVFSLYYLLPLRNTLRFGSDLVGGVFLTLGVKTEEAVNADLIAKMSNMTAALKKVHKNPSKKMVQNGSIIFEFQTLQLAQEAVQILKSEFNTLTPEVVGTKVLYRYSNNATAEKIKRDALYRNVEVLRLRLNKFSVAEIAIAVQGEKNITVELPDVSDIQKAKDYIGKNAQLDFRLVDRIGTSRQELLYEYDGQLPDDKEILAGREDDRKVFYVVERYPQVTGRMLKDARASLGGKTGIEATVVFSFDAEGGERFYQLTSKNFGRQLAIVLDGQVMSAPRIDAAIKDQGEITGGFSSDEAKTTALLLKSGAFVAPVSFEEERLIGPALGIESQQKGLISCIISIILIFIFSIVFYRLCGFFAFLALCFNVILILVGLAKLQATLTLPGISGIVLTIGMAIDASILIFERIKEEIARGVSVRNAVHTGFKDAMVVILDGNITTFIVGIVLYHFGSGPVQGFAVTMMLGIVATLVTGLFFLKALFKFYLANFEVKKLSI